MTRDHATDLAAILEPDRGQAAHELCAVDANGFKAWLAGLPARQQQAVAAHGFEAAPGQWIFLTGNDESRWSAIIGVEDMENLDIWCLAKAAEALPPGRYRIAGAWPAKAALGWALGQYRFDRYKKKAPHPGRRSLLCNEPFSREEVLALVEAIFLVRDMVNIPAQDFGPAQLESTIA
jgi:leucyl aminopeptidase